MATLLRSHGLVLVYIAWLLVPVRGEEVIITQDLRIAATNTAFEGFDLVVRGGRLQVEGPHTFGSLSVSGSGDARFASPELRLTSLEVGDASRVTLAGGSVLLVAGPSRLSGQARVVCESANSTATVLGSWRGTGVRWSTLELRVDPEATLEAHGQGYRGGEDRGRPGKGPGGGGPAGDFGVGGGAGYGGAGARPASRPHIYAGSPYGDPAQPVDLGSGGGGAEQSRAGSGGGALQLEISGRLHLDGVIGADGESGTGNAGGGSGGSILVTASEVVGTGRLQAKGGAGGAGGGGGGSGGRIAVYGQHRSFAGHTACSVEGGDAGSEGTLIFVDPTQPSGSLSLYHRLALPDGTTNRWGDVEMHPGSLLELGRDSRLALDRSLIAGSSAGLVLSGGSTLVVTNELRLDGSNSWIRIGAKNLDAPAAGQWQGVGATIDAGRLTISAQAWISADGQGYLGGEDRGRPGKGPGGGGPAGDFGLGGGAGHGGVGARPAVRPQVYGGTDYGSAFLPVDPGSGGGGAESSRPGSGGGAIRLLIRSVLQLDGLLSANGEAGHANAGGGSGGSILVETTELKGDGRLEARGGSGGPGGGGGGAGGRVVVYYQRSQFTGQGRCSVSGGGAADEGTLVFVDRSTAQPELLIHQRLALPTGTTHRWGGIHVYPKGRVILGPDARLAVDRDFVVDGEGEVVLGGGAWLAVTNHLHLVGSNAVVNIEGKNRSQLVDGQWRGAGATLQAGQLTLHADARIQADGQGYVGGEDRGRPGKGPGGGGPAGDFGVGGGGGYGGSGARPASRPQVYGGPVNGDPRIPFDLGSGGGGAEYSIAGAGGGAIHLIVGDRFVLDGVVRANGDPGTGSAGSGSGGSILVQAGTLTGRGRVEAQGGAGSPNAGSGGGGRIALYTWDRSFFPASACLLEPGGYGAGGTAGSRVIAGPETEVIWSGSTAALLHGVVSLGWTDLGVNPIGANASLILEGEGLQTVIASARTTRDSITWDTTVFPDGDYELRLVIRDAAGRVVREWPRRLALNNTAEWHTGTLRQNETWFPRAVHLVEGDFTVAPGVTLRILPGTVVKSALNTRWTISDGAAVIANGAEGSEVVLTSQRDDTAGGDTNCDGARSVPLPGDWRLVREGSGRWVANDATRLLYATERHAGTLAAGARFAGHLLHEILDELQVPAGQTLVIEPGAIVKFHPNAAFNITTGARLQALGTLAAPIVFTSIRDDTVGGDSNNDGGSLPPSAGDWRSILVSGEATLEHTELRYGGGSPSGQWERSGLLRCEGDGKLLLRRCELREARFDGLLGSGSVTLEACVLRSSDRALAVHGGRVRAVNCTFDDNRIGVQLHGGQLELWNSLITRSATAGVVHDLGLPNYSIRYCGFWNPTATAGNTDGIPDAIGRDGNQVIDPRFIDADHGDYRLDYRSPAIDAADGTVAPSHDRMDAPRYDDPRTVNAGTATTSGAFADLGAHEFVETADSDLDLVVDQVSGPSEVVAGKTVRVHWTVRNVGVGTLDRAWHDAITLEPVEAPTSARSTRVAEIASSALLGSGQSVTFFADVRVPGVSEGLWRWAVRANHRGDIFEGRNAWNNHSTAVADTQVIIPSVARGQTIVASFGGEGVADGYRLTPDLNHPCLIVLDAATTQGRCALYAARGRMPTTTDFDWRSRLGDSSDVRLSLPPFADSQPIYLLVIPETLRDGQLGYTLTAERPTFALTSLALTRAGNRGEVTVPVSGTGLADELELRLESESGAVVTARSVSVLAGDLAVATFDLSGVAPGLYDIVGRREGQQVRLTRAFLVESGGEPTVRARVVLPTVVRAGRPFTAYVEFANEGDINAPAPLFVLRVAGGSSTLRCAADPQAGGATLSLLGLAQGLVMPDVLPPGSRFVLPFQVTAAGTDAVQCDLFVHETGETQPMDYARLSSAITPGVGGEAWENAWRTVTQQAGTTVGQFVRTLGQTATRAASLGITLTTERQALEFLTREALEKHRVSRVQGRLFLGNTDHPLGDTVVFLESTPRPSGPGAATNAVFSTLSWHDGTFAVPDATPGRYSVRVEGYTSVAPDRLVVPAEPTLALTNLTLLVSRAAGRIQGETTDGLGGTPVPDAHVELTQEASGRRSSAWTDAEGRFELTDVAPGDYLVSARSEGRLPGLTQNITVVEGGTAWISLVFPGGGGSVSGVLRDSEGRLVAGANVFAARERGTGTSDVPDPLPATSQADGRYTLAGLPNGTYRLTAVAPDGETWIRASVTVLRAGEQVTLDLVIPRSVAIEGQVIDAATRRPLTNAMVVANALRPGERPQRIGPDGRFVDPKIPAGSPLLVAWSPGYLPQLIRSISGPGSSGPVLVELVPGVLTDWVSRAPETGSATSALASNRRATQGHALAGKTPAPWTQYLPPEMYTYPPTLYTAYWMSPEYGQDQAMFDAALAAFAKLKSKCKSLNTDKVIADLELMREAIEDVQDLAEDFADELGDGSYQSLERAFAGVIDLPTDLYAALDGIVADCALTESDPARLGIDALQGYAVETLLKTYRGNFQLEWNLLELEDQLSDLEAHLQANDLGACTTAARSTLLRFRDSVLPDTRLQLQRLQSLDNQYDNIYSELLDAVGRYTYGAASFREDFPRMVGRGKNCGGGGEDGGFEEPPAPPCVVGPLSPALAGTSPCPPQGGGAAKVVGSFDPNDKVATGYGPLAFVAADEPLRYTIHFENVATASAPAQQVTVMDVLDPSLDLSTFQPLRMVFNGTSLEVPPGALPFSATTFVVSDPNPVVASVNLDPRTGVVVWQMTSMDPVTGMLPEDPWAGFLPPNDAQHRGEGYVTFQIRTQPSVTSDVIITNRASIVFDANPPILTPIATNRIDTTPPESRIEWVASDTRGVWIQWSGSDNRGGSGVAGYDILVSSNGAPFEIWREGVTATDAFYPARAGSRVAFYSIAVDAVGLREAAPVAPDVDLIVPPVLGVEGVRPFALAWETADGIVYQVERSFELGPAAKWERVADSVVGANGTARFRATETADRAFYRVRLK